MATGWASNVSQHLRRAALLQDGAGLTDGQLLGCFLEHRDATAFAALVKRHGPMVWGVCRRLLGHHDAEDAFQAAFLVLFRKAASIRPREHVANWLYGVARRTALYSRRAAARRRGREAQVADMPEPAVTEVDSWHDVQPVLDEALSRLPDKYRLVIVLCDLEYRTRKEAARQLGCPEGTVAGRLARARGMLAKRLARQGVALSGAVLAGVLAQKAATASMPASVVSATVEAAGQAAAGGLASARVAALVEGVVKAMLVSKLKTALAVLAAAGMVAFGGGLLLYPRAAAQQAQAEKVPASVPQAKGSAAGGKEPPAVQDERKQFVGSWQVTSVEIEGRKLSERQIKGELVYPMARAVAQNEGAKFPDRLTWSLQETRGLVFVFDAEGHVKQQTGRGMVLWEGTYTIDPGRTPKTIEYTGGLRGFGHHSPVQGIYEFVNKDTCRVCEPPTGQQLPREFSAKAGTRNILLVLERLPQGGGAEKPASGKEPGRVSYEDFVELNHGGDGVTATGVKGKGGFTVVPLKSAKGGSAFALSFAVKEGELGGEPDFRVVAVDNNGKRHKARFQGAVSAGGDGIVIVTLLPEFDLTSANIKSFIIQRRVK